VACFFVRLRKGVQIRYVSGRRHECNQRRIPTGAENCDASVGDERYRWVFRSKKEKTRQVRLAGRRFRGRRMQYRTMQALVVIQNDQLPVGLHVVDNPPPQPQVLHAPVREFLRRSPSAAGSAARFTKTCPSHSSIPTLCSG